MAHILSSDVNYDKVWIGIVSVINKFTEINKIQIKVSEVTLDQKPK